MTTILSNLIAREQPVPTATGPHPTRHAAKRIRSPPLPSLKSRISWFAIVQPRNANPAAGGPVPVTTHTDDGQGTRRRPIRTGQGQQDRHQRTGAAGVGDPAGSVPESNGRYRSAGQP